MAGELSSSWCLRSFHRGFFQDFLSQLGMQDDDDDDARELAVKSVGLSMMMMMMKYIFKVFSLPAQSVYPPRSMLGKVRLLECHQPAAESFTYNLH